MTLSADLHAAADRILDEASVALDRAGVAHYRAAGPRLTRARLADLFAVLVECVRSQDMLPITKVIDGVARERYQQGVGLFEVQTAVNVLEEAVWRFVAAHEPTNNVAASLAQVSAILGAAKDQLGRTYVELAAGRHAPAVDVAALAGGAAAGVG